MSTEHPKDLSKMLADLVSDGFLVSRGVSRGTAYYFVDEAPETGTAHHDELSPVPIASTSSQQTTATSQQTPESSQQTRRGSQQSEFSKVRENLIQIAEPVRKNRRSPRALVREIIIKVCHERFLTAQEIASVLNREALTLQTHYLNELVEERLLDLKYPDKITHPQQAYRATGSRD